MSKCFLFLLFHYSFCWSYIYHIKVMRIWDNDKKLYRHIIGFFDVHKNNQKKNKAHRSDLQDFFRVCDKKKTHVIVEDLQKIPDNNGNSLLAGLTTLLYRMGYTPDNIEYRYLRAAAFGPLFKQVTCKSNTQSLPSITLQQICNEINNKITDCKIKVKDDNLKVKLNKSIDVIQSSYKKYKWDRYKSQTVSSFMRSNYQFNSKKWLESFLVFDGTLFDIHLTHEILSQKKELIVVIAGGSHLQNSFDHLKKCGYELLFSQNLQSVKYNSIEKILRNFSFF